MPHAQAQPHSEFRGSGLDSPDGHRFPAGLHPVPGNRGIRAGQHIRTAAVVAGAARHGHEAGGGARDGAFHRRRARCSVPARPAAQRGNRCVRGSDPDRDRYLDQRRMAGNTLAEGRAAARRHHVAGFHPDGLRRRLALRRGNLQQQCRRSAAAGALQHLLRRGGDRACARGHRGDRLGLADDRGVFHLAGRRVAGIGAGADVDDLRAPAAGAASRTLLAVIAPERMALRRWNARHHFPDADAHAGRQDPALPVARARRLWLLLTGRRGRQRALHAGRPYHPGILPANEPVAARAAPSASSWRPIMSVHSS